MLKEFAIIKTILKYIIPYVILYAIYIQLNGEISPGGGFQAGVIFASGIIGYDLIGGLKQVNIDSKMLIICGVLGVLIYAITGTISFYYDDNYLNYNHISQHTGIFVIELGVGLTVWAVMCLIYLALREEK